MASRAHKKTKLNEVKGQDQHRERIQDRLFALEYLHNTMNYLLPNASPADGCLEVDQTALQNIIQGNPNQLGLLFIQKLKLMKQKCDEGILVENYQQHGDFINYDIPKEHCQQVRALQAELREEHQKIIAIKRIRLKYPQAPEQMSLPQLKRWQQKIKQDVLDSLLKNIEKMSEEPQPYLEKSALYRDMFNLSSQIQGKNDIEKRQSKPASIDGLTSHKKKITTDSKREPQGKQQDKTKKISKGSKKGDSKVDLQEEYVPKVGKKNGKLEQSISNLSERNQVVIESLGGDSGQYIMPRRSNQTAEEKQQMQASEIKKEQISMAPQSEKEQVPLNLSVSSAQPKVKRKYAKTKKEQKEPTGKTINQTKSKPFKEKAAHPKEYKLSLKQKVETAMIVESSEPQNKLISLERDGDQFKRPVQVSIGIQADVQTLQKEISKEENQPSLLHKDQIIKKQEDIQLGQRENVQNDPSKLSGEIAIEPASLPDLGENPVIEQMGTVVPMSIQHEQMRPEVELEVQLSQQPINIEGPSSNNSQDEPDINELLKLD